MPAMMKLALTIVVILIGLVLTIDLNTTREGRGVGIKVRWWGLALSALLLLGTFDLEAGSGQVGPSERGIVVRFGAATGQTLQPGLFFVTPFIDRVELMDIQTHAYEAPASAASSDLQDVSTTVTVNYRVDPSKVREV